MKKEKNIQFSELAEYYDRFNGADYGRYSDYVCNVMKKYGVKGSDPVLDLGCGTGSLTLALAKKGLDMIGIDISADMLSKACENAYGAQKSILYLMQDMRSFELYGTVDAIVCALDGISYLESREDVIKCLKLVRNYLNPGGVFLFDVNSVSRFKALSKRDYFLEEDGAYLGWKSYMDEGNKYCDFALTLFIEDEDGRYVRKEEIQREMVLGMDEIISMLKEAGLEFCEVWSDTEFSRVKDDSEKWYFVARCPEKK